MTPFPEVELVTLDRLEVALRNNNMKLLKEGSYKLHEKYHGGHKFEYFDKIKSIYYKVCSDSSIPKEIKDILCPTIEDIFLDNGLELNGISDESLGQNRVSSLTQLSYNASNQANTEHPVITETAPREEKISAFDVFGTKRNDENNSYTQSPFHTENNAPFQEFKMPEPQGLNGQTHLNQTPVINEQQTLNTSNVMNVAAETVQQPAYENAPVDTQIESYQQPIEEIKTKLENIAIFYLQDTSNEKVRNILRYRELISKLHDEHYSINEILHLISEINVQSNTNILEVKNILDQLQLNKNHVSLITNSTSANLIGLMEQGGYSYSLYEKDKDKQINLIPVFGLSNQFICSNCDETYLDKEDKINPLVLQCPRCKNPMFPNFYTADNKEIQMNLDYYNNALMELVNSDVWVVIHPIAEDKVMTNLIMSAIKLNSSLKQIYILDKDINIREDLKNRFMSIKNNLDININLSALEDFLNSIR